MDQKPMPSVIDRDRGEYRVVALPIWANARRQKTACLRRQIRSRAEKVRPRLIVCARRLCLSRVTAPRLFVRSEGRHNTSRKRKDPASRVQANDHTSVAHNRAGSIKRQYSIGAVEEQQSLPRLNSQAAGIGDAAVFAESAKQFARVIEGEHCPYPSPLMPEALVTSNGITAHLSRRAVGWPSSQCVHRPNSKALMLLLFPALHGLWSSAWR